MRNQLSLLVAVCASALSCQSTNEPPASQKAGQAQLTTYPPGRWRLATFDELDRSIVWLAHIVIRHEKSTAQGHEFRPHGWQPDDPPPQRSRADALHLAQRVWQQAAASPDEFAALAREYSEDISSRDRGGSLGGTRASQLGAAFLDALQAVQPGRVTAVIETSFGFHILKRLPPPQAVELAGQQLLIRYQGSINRGSTRTPERTRAQAMELAGRFAASEEPFQALVAAHSEHPSKARGGDMGVWSSIAPRSNGRELETLAALKLDAVSEPFDTPLGVQIVKRVALTPREHYAAATIRVRYAAAQPDSNAAARRRADALAAELQADPTRLATLQVQEGCCADEVLQWTRGSTYDEALEAAVSQLAIGETTRQPIDLGRYYVIAKRLSLELASEPAVLSYELPAPAAPNSEAILRHTDRDTLVSEVRAFKAAFLRNTPLAQPQTATIGRLLDELEQSFAQSKNGEERVAAQRRMRGALEQQLDGQAIAAFQRFRDTWMVNRVMSNSRL